MELAHFANRIGPIEPIASPIRRYCIYNNNHHHEMAPHLRPSVDKKSESIAGVRLQKNTGTRKRGSTKFQWFEYMCNRAIHSFLPVAQLPELFLCYKCSPSHHPSNHELPSNNAVLIHSLHVSKQSQRSDPLYSPTLSLYSSSSTHVFYPNFVYSYQSHKTSNFSKYFYLKHNPLLSQHFLCPMPLYLRTAHL